MSLATGNVTVGTTAVELAVVDTGGSLQKSLLLQSAGEFYVGNAAVTADANATTGGWRVPVGAVYGAQLERGERIWLRAATSTVVNFCWSDV